MEDLFKEFKIKHSAQIEPGYIYDFIGVKVPMAFNGVVDWQKDKCPYVDQVGQVPPLSEEYLEWIDLLESVRAATGTFTMVELGAGYGRWLLRAHAAAKIAGIQKVNLIGVEADPVHYGWMLEAFKINKATQAVKGLFEAVASISNTSKKFLIANLNNEALTPEVWYGQTVIRKDRDDWTKLAGRTYAGKEMYTLSSGWCAINVDTVMLRDIICDHDYVDLVDLDIQGYELDVLQFEADTLQSKVKKVHVGTHSREIDAGLIELFSLLGWECLRVHLSNSVGETRYGTVTFQDGIQTWVNPNL